MRHPALADRCSYRPPRRPTKHGPARGAPLRDIVRKDELRPLFRTTVRRIKIELEAQSAARIEAAIDEGEIRGAENGAIEPISGI